MESKLNFNQKVQIILSKFEEHNKINKDIKRYGNIFNTFAFTWEIKKPNLFFELKSTDYDENNFSITSLAGEQSIEINIENDNEVNWLIKTLNKFIEKSYKTMKKAREFSKPNVGILIYDEFTDSYFLNPTTGPILLKSKEILKEISSTRIDIFNIFINLRSIAVEEDRRIEIFGYSKQQIIKSINQSINNIKECSTKIRKIEGIPRYIATLKQEEEKIFYNNYATVNYDLESENLKKVNEVQVEANLEKIEDLEKIYIQIRRDEEINKTMMDLARSLIAKNEPKLYTQNSITGMWTLSKEGRDTMRNLNIIDFINTDISEINYEIY
ncbi:hypothetical protein [Spiroplasma floricola]|uniref:Uncharacterized protein n=1 Tax=Spiroplasma floricola 23-6 TaxID=1336749 RepID=A0A2K8SDH4_9MOLU|nr:hypothetical protein [Spiroplasma floricola]AUB31517.1 hypothetical protein SFLOR_v1c04650 [Spiroplasma floricola 23-6]